MIASRPEPRDRAEPTPEARDRGLLPREVVRAAATLAVVIALLLSVTDVWAVAFEGGWWDRMTRFDVSVLVTCTTLTFALHVRHVLHYAVRGERPPAAAWTLAALVVATAIGVWFGGPVWTRSLALLAVSTLIIVPLRWALPAVAVIALAPLVVIDARWYDVGRLPGTYFTLAIVWRTVTQYLPLRLLAVLRALDAATQELEARACISARARIEVEVRRLIGPTLRQILVRGESSRASAEVNPDRAIAELRLLVGESRRGLAESRRVAASYRTASLRDDLDAATALLEASGAHVQLLVEDGVSLDTAEAAQLQDGHSLRTAVTAALRREPCSHYQILVTRDDSGRLRLRIAADEPASDAAQDPP